MAIKELPDFCLKRRQELIEAVSNEYLERARMQEQDLPRWVRAEHQSCARRVGRTSEDDK
ncbi:hypothetical protein AJ87_11660 [Rhizobium yanglingense]|nr:hypothetical protein AJ87_11660 [Rhizobium yanglingense]